MPSGLASRNCVKGTWDLGAGDWGQNESPRCARDISRSMSAPDTSVSDRSICNFLYVFLSLVCGYFAPSAHSTPRGSATLHAFSSSKPLVPARDTPHKEMR